MTRSVPLDDLLAHRTWVRRLAIALVRDVHDADELVQDAFVAALRSPPEDPAAVRPWFRRVLTRLAMNRRRGEIRRVAREAAVLLPEAPATPPDAVAALEEHRRVVDAVLALPGPARETVVMRFFDGLAPAEIAERLGLPASTVRSRLQRAVEMLRERLDRDHGGDGRTWQSALLPLLVPAGRRPLRLPGRAVAAALAVGAFLVKLKMIVSFAALLALSLLAWHSTRTPPGPGQPAGTPSSPAVGRPARTAERARVVPREQEAVRPSSEQATDAPAEPPSVATVPEPEPTGLRLDITVLRPDGRPAAGAVVRFSDPTDGFVEIEEEPDGPEESAERASEPGRVFEAGPWTSLRTDPAGRLRIRSSSPVVRAWVEHDGATGTSSLVDLQAGATERVTVRLVAPHEIAGVVTDTAGEPVADALVIVWGEGAMGRNRVADAITDAAGSYRIRDVPHEVIARGAAVTVSTARYLRFRRELAPTDASRVVLDAALERGSIVTGRLVDEDGKPVAGAFVFDVDLSAQDRSDADGRFRLAALPSDAVTLQVVPGAHADRRVRVPARSGGEHHLGDVVLRRGGTVKGRVVDAEGRPLAFGMVYLTGERGQEDVRRPDRTRKDGRFRLSAVGDETYSLIVTVPDAAGNWRKGRYLFRDGVRAGDELELVASDALTMLVTLVERRAGGAPATADGCTLEVAATDGSGRTWPQMFAGLDAGNVRAAFPAPGRYRVTIRVPGYVPVVLDDVEALPDREVRRRVELRHRDE